MTASAKLVGALSRLLNDELHAGPRVRAVTVPMVQGESWTWCFVALEGSGFGEGGPPSPLAALSEAEIFGYSQAGDFFLATGEMLYERRAKDEVLAPPVSDTLSQYARQRLSDPSPPFPFLFLRLKPDWGALDADKLATELRRLTWLRCRSLPPELAHRRMEIEVGAHKVLLAPQLETPAVAFQAGDGYYAGFTAIGGKAGVRYNIYGRDGTLQNEAIAKEVFLDAAGFPAAQGYGYDFSVPLEFDALLPSTDDAGRTVLQGLKAAPQHIRDQLCATLRLQLDQTRQEYMNRLDERKQQLHRRRQLSLATEPLGLEPTCEHEVLILTGKMEAALRKQLHEFMVLEHTPQIDIDGILHIRREAGLHLQEAATVEFEYDLPNFFKHQHPIPITEYIICWTVRPLEDKVYRFGAKGIQEAGPLSVEMCSLGWMKVLRFADHMIYVLPLEQFPGLTIRPAARVAGG